MCDFGNPRVGRVCREEALISRNMRRSLCCPDGQSGLEGHLLSTLKLVPDVLTVSAMIILIRTRNNPSAHTRRRIRNLVRRSILPMEDSVKPRGVVHVRPILRLPMSCFVMPFSALWRLQLLDGLLGIGV